VTKKEIVRQIADRIDETQLKTKEIVQLTFDAIIDTLINDRRIELRNFGVFEVKLRKARKARNPRTRGQVEVPPRYVVTFKPGKEMEDRVGKLTPTREELDRLEQKAAKARARAAAAAQAAGRTNPPPQIDGNASADGEPESPRKKKTRKPTQV
jgi:nucleoid DNA-binding protein